eukprot:CAMPEP_0183755074 /NCGR_PEP_ID=MMETSP0739-20130205/3909_1 /TAXON_ID=385413 /ORGANISM="Thalassiosira miniscula, Strain CCMP1093" /LENGTH=133 /DNA_ID=CAMNT_0025991773 /DNA_START=308 /DNA_END=709 /DNA_ORIENTATION=+
MDHPSTTKTEKRNSSDPELNTGSSVADPNGSLMYAPRQGSHPAQLQQDVDENAMLVSHLYHGDNPWPKIMDPNEPLEGQGETGNVAAALVKGRNANDEDDFEREMGADEHFFGLCHSDPIDSIDQDAIFDENS